MSGKSSLLLAPLKRIVGIHSAKSLISFAVAIVSCLLAASVSGQSYYPQKLEDASAVYVTLGSGRAAGDGIADDTAALQRAIDKVQETTQQGVVFLPEGRYRLSHTLYVWPGIRIIGYGAKRPVLLLGDHTSGYGGALAYMVFFTGGRPDAPGTLNRAHRSQQRRPHHDEIFPGTVPATNQVIDANPGTFYSAMSNVDFDLGEGNPGAVGIRFHAAQHCFLTHMEFRIHSGLAALNDVGNEGEDLHFIGGQYGIITSKPSPGWQYTLLDSSFDGQSKAAVKEHEAGLTLVRDSFSHLPEAVSIDPGYAEELWIKDSRFEDISGPAITVSNENNARTEIILVNTACRKVPVFAHLRESNKDFAAPRDQYVVKAFSHGLTLGHVGDIGEIRTSFETDITAAAAKLPLAIRDLPSHNDWANLRSLGAKGDGVSDDTTAIRRAIAGNKIVFVPAGRYRVTDTILLKPDSVLIGLHPSTTQFFLADNTNGFNGPGGPKPLLETPEGGAAIVSGIGIYTGGTNSRAVGVLWKSGERSLMDDVRFLGGHGTNSADGTRMNPYNANHTGDPDPNRRWDGQFPSLWVTDGGGGTFADIWTPSTFADAGLYVSNTSTPGHVYELSSEHHVRMEVKLNHVSNWELVALQTEEEHGEGGGAVPLEIADSSHIVIANFHSYRVVGMLQTFPYGVMVSHSNDIQFRNLHMDSNSKVSFDDAILNRDTGATVRFREFASLTVNTSLPPNDAGQEAIDVHRIATGFHNIAGAAVAPNGDLYFVDAYEQKVYRWSPGNESTQGTLTTICDAPLDIANLAIDASGDLMLVSYSGNGTVYSLKAGDPPTKLTLIPSQSARPLDGLTAVHANDYWALREKLAHPETSTNRFQFISADGKMFLSADEDFSTGALFYGTKMADVLRTFGLQPSSATKPFYVSDEEEQKTYAAHLDASGNLTDVKLFAERGGEGVASDSSGNVYIASGEVFVYKPNGSDAGVIRMPERPINLVVARAGRKEKLYILARTSLYEVDLPHE